MTQLTQNKENTMKYLQLTSAFVLSGILATSTMALETNQAVIYDTQCAKCHGVMAEGVPAKKGPALNHQSVGDMQVEIMDMQGEMSYNGNSGSGKNPDMEHNLEVFKNKGIVIEPLGIAQYIYNNFNKSAVK